MLNTGRAKKTRESECFDLPGHAARIHRKQSDFLKKPTLVFIVSALIHSLSLTITNNLSSLSLRLFVCLSLMRKRQGLWEREISVALKYSPPPPSTSPFSAPFPRPNLATLLQPLSCVIIPFLLTFLFSFSFRSYLSQSLISLRSLKFTGLMSHVLLISISFVTFCFWFIPCLF